ncbi:MAG: arginyl-tRNA synthetase [Crocinitomicaceae bacterium]|jgi:arginyl-tRNA synthetase|nr:arginyl-tRNA synthetase [Crocinitomicaceae bacterium]
METRIRELLVKNSEFLFGTEIDPKTVQFQLTRKDFEGDLTLVVFPFVKLLRVSPDQAAQKIGDFLVENMPDIKSFQVVQGFLNLSLTEAYWMQVLQEIAQTKQYGFKEAGSKGTVMVEYSSPNTNKPLHLGHLRNNFLGYSVAEILKANGHKVVKTQIINDRGIHICKSMLAWERFSPLNEKGERESPENTGLKGDKLVGKYYVEFDKRFNAEAKEIIAAWEKGDFDGYNQKVVDEYNKFVAAKEGKDEKAIAAIDDKIKDLAKNQTELLRDANEMLLKWEGRDPQVYLLWSTMNGWVYKGFEETYRKMGVDFDKLYYESETYLIGKDVVDEGLQKGVFYRKEDSSVWIDLTKDGLDEKLLLRSNGTAVYMTQDVGTAIDRFRDYPDLEGIIYTVGNEQDYHFKVLFLILQKLGYSWAEACYHLSYGMVDLPSGKMKSREGTVVDADDLMDEVVASAKAMTQERGHIEGMAEEEKEKLYRMIGMGGLKYYLLKVDPKKRMLFNPEESIELTGNTGPFIQYAYARIKSLLRKAGEIGEVGNTVPGAEEKEIIKQLELFPAIIEEAAASYSPAVLINYTYELVKIFSQFYQTVKVNSEPDAGLRNLRLMICDNVGKVVASSMQLIGVEVPERM